MILAQNWTKNSKNKRDSASLNPEHPNFYQSHTIYDMPFHVWLNFL